MRGDDQASGGLFSYVDLEARVPKDHPLRLIRGIVNDGVWDATVFTKYRDRDFHGEKRSNASHASTSDGEARLYRKGRGRRRVEASFTLALAAYNLIRLPRLPAEAPP